jgi:hypothetical protein
LANNVAVADKIVIDGKQHEDVVISSSESLYYVSFPKLGTTVSVRKSDISDEDILIDSSGEERSALFAEWKLANTRVKEQREEVKRKKEFEALEKERLKVHAEQEKKEAEDALAREHIRLKKEQLGLRASQVLAGEPEKFSQNLQKVEEAEKVAIDAELDELESELKNILLQSSDPSNAVVPERIKKRVEELGDMGREKAKLNSRDENEPGYSLETRKAAAITVLMGQGMSRSEAMGTVEDMVKNDMLPDPSVKGSEGDKKRQYVYSASTRRTAAIETLIENGWERSDAETGVENIKHVDGIPNWSGVPSESSFSTIVAEMEDRMDQEKHDETNQSIAKETTRDTTASGIEIGRTYALGDKCFGSIDKEDLGRAVDMLRQKDNEAFASMVLSGRIVELSAGTTVTVEEVSLLGKAKVRVTGEAVSVWVSTSWL